MNVTAFGIMDPREEIRLSPYQPEWPSMFQEERVRLAHVLGRMSEGIEHIGSTAVPGLLAKPIIDIMVLVEEFDLDQLRSALLPLDYEHLPIDESGRLFFRKGLPRTYHLHVVIKDSWEHHHHIAFRDWLREHPDDAREYGEMKRTLARRFRQDRDAYCEAKSIFVERLLVKATGHAL
ncbi:MAG: GrpB family protein [Methanomassiliicoccales archaeon]|nr:GrpB family protein [Methanomassiliicoccales archaeon]